MVVAGDAVVGRTLQRLLHGADYRVRYVAGFRLGEPRALVGTDLLVLAPGLTEGQEAALLPSAAGTRALAELPEVRLVPDLREETGVGTARSPGPAAPRSRRGR